MMNNVERTMHTQEDRLQRLRAGLAVQGTVGNAGGEVLADQSVMAQKFLQAGLIQGAAATIAEGSMRLRTDAWNQQAQSQQKDAPVVQAELAAQAEAVDRMHKLLEVLQGRLGWVLEEAEQPKTAALQAGGEPVTSGRRSRLVQELRAGSARLLSLEWRLKDLAARVKL